MKDRLITLLGAFIAFYILFRLLFPQVDFTQEKISFPTTEDHGKYGLAGLYHWLDKAQVSLYSLRERYDTLANNPQLAERNNLLITSLPHRSQSQNNELQQLQTWVNAGNHILLLAAMSDWPQWADRNMDGTLVNMLERFGVRISSEDDEEKPDENESDDEKAETTATAVELDKVLNPVTEIRILKPAVSHPLTQGVTAINSIWLSSEGLQWHLKGKRDTRSCLVLLRDQADQSPAMWMSFYGDGKILITRHSDLFGNLTLAEADNAVLISNIIQHLVGQNGKVIFDDMHQGLSVTYDPEAFFHDPRLHHTLLFLLALWIVYVMGYTNRFGYVQNNVTRLHLHEHIRAIGNLFARRLHTSAVAMRVARHFFNDVRSFYGLPQNGEPVWELLGHNAAIKPSVLQRAQVLYQRATQHKRINLVIFVNILKTIRRELS